MFERSNHEFSLLRRGAVLALALILLFAQSLATAHYHQKDLRTNVTQSVQANDALCSLCLFRFHAPADPGAPHASAAPTAAIWRLTPQARMRLHGPALALVLSRGPPATL
jgi:hypothetical protein